MYQLSFKSFPVTVLTRSKSHLSRLHEPLVVIQTLRGLVHSQITSTNDARETATRAWVELLQSKVFCFHLRFRSTHTSVTNQSNDKWIVQAN